MKHLLSFMIVLFCALSLSDDAEAKRFSVRGGYVPSSSSSSEPSSYTPPPPKVTPIPAGSTDIIFIKELPYTSEFIHNNEHVDLGYKFGYFGYGEWVGYLRQSQSYVEMNQDAAVSKILPMVGLTTAATPKRPLWEDQGALGLGAFTLLLLGLFGAFKFIQGGRSTAAQSLERFDSEVSGRLAPRNARSQPGPEPQRSGNPMRAAMPQMSSHSPVPRGGGFGRRPL